jgi:hypothetical protein
MLAFAKKQNKEVWLFICWVKLGLYSFDCNVFGLKLSIELIFF